VVISPVCYELENFAYWIPANKAACRPLVKPLLTVVKQIPEKAM
jgi:hypothetical protein